MEQLCNIQISKFPTFPADDV